jgi:Sulfotransferase family
MLGAHSSVISPPELHLLAYPTFEDWQRQYPAAMDSLDFLLASCAQSMDKKRIEAQFAGQTTEFVYRWIASQENVQPRIIVDKTPKYARDLGALQRTTRLDADYIWLIRHPLAVATSQIVLRLEQRRQRNVELVSRLKYPLFRIRTAMRKQKELHDEVVYWTWVNMQIDQFLATVTPERRHRVNFEQLVREPRAVMDRLCSWLGIGFEPSMLDPHGHIPSVLNPTLGDPKVRRHTCIDPAVADSWREHCSEQILDGLKGRFLAVPTRELMARWGITSKPGSVRGIFFFLAQSVIIFLEEMTPHIGL